MVVNELRTLNVRAHVTQNKTRRAASTAARRATPDIGFTWAGFDKMTEVSGAGSAELQEDGSLQIEFDYHLGDEAVLRAVRDPSSTA